jgi:hypothetical protein
MKVAEISVSKLLPTRSELSEVEMSHRQIMPFSSKIHSFHVTQSISNSIAYALKFNLALRLARR